MLMLYTCTNMINLPQFITGTIDAAQQLFQQPASRRSAAFAGSSIGFTIVELLIVIVVIGILAAIVIVAFNGVQARANDTHRVSDVDKVKKFMELYYVKNGYYPGSGNIADANASTALSTGVLQGLSPDALRAPDATGSTVSSWGQWGGSVTTDGMNYSYKTFYADDANCIGLADQCAKYQIYYRTDADSSYKVIRSLSGW